MLPSSRCLLRSLGPEPRPLVLRTNCPPKRMTRASWLVSTFAICSQFCIKTASNSTTSTVLSSIIPSGSSYSRIILTFMHKCGLATVSYVLVFVFWFYALVFFTHFWPGSPINWSSIRQLLGAYYVSEHLVSPSVYFSGTDRNPSWQGRARQ